MLADADPEPRPTRVVRQRRVRRPRQLHRAGPAPVRARARRGRRSASRRSPPTSSPPTAAASSRRSATRCSSSTSAPRRPPRSRSTSSRRWPTTTCCPTCACGMARGPVISRLGDVFGTTVNRASRLTAVAQPGQRARRRRDGRVARQPLRLRADRAAPRGPCAASGRSTPSLLRRAAPVAVAAARRAEPLYGDDADRPTKDRRMTQHRPRHRWSPSSRHDDGGPRRRARPRPARGHERRLDGHGPAPSPRPRAGVAADPRRCAASC